MCDLGYTSYNPIINLGTLAFLLFCYVAKIVFTFGVLLPMSMKYTRAKTRFGHSVKQLFFGDLLVIFIEGYLEFLISSFLIFGAPDSSTDKTPFTIGIGVIGFLISNIVVPCIIFFHLRTNSTAKFESNEFQLKWGVLYRNLKFKSKIQIAYSIVFILRRMVYVWVAVYGIHQPGLQIIALNLSNFGIQLYQGQKPFKTP